jgi:hypothetical protein
MTPPVHWVWPQLVEILDSQAFKERMQRRQSPVDCCRRHLLATLLVHKPVNITQVDFSQWLLAHLLEENAQVTQIVFGGTTVPVPPIQILLEEFLGFLGVHRQLLLDNYTPFRADSV